MMQSFVMMAVVTLLWAVVGYSLASATGTSFIGGLPSRFPARRRRAPDPDYAATIPHRPSWSIS